MRIKKIVASLFSLGMVASPFAHATNGMNLEGYGPVAEAMGGASMAYDNGVAAVMNNPATLGLMKDGTSEFGGGLGILAPAITAKVPGASVDSSSTAFYMPAAGYARKSGQWAYGAAVFSQGGMGTEYSANSFMAAGSGETVRSSVGVGRFIIPLVYQPDDKITIGGSLDFVWAAMDLKMALTGAQFGDMVSSLGGTQTYGSASGSLVNTLGGAMGAGLVTGLNWARVDFNGGSQFTGQAKGNGGAFKLGGTYKVNSQLTVGATYHSKTSLGDLTTTGASMSMNVNLGAGMGGGTATVPVTGSVSVHNFQWPETIAMGAAYQATDNLQLVADYKRIGWKNVMKGFNMTFTADATQTGTAAAFGMGGKSVDMSLYQNWEDQNVFEFGGAYKTSDAVTLRAGLNLANNPVPDKYMNPLFPAIARNHVTMGVGYEVTKQSNLNFSYVYVPKVSSTNGQGVTVDFGGYSTQLVYAYMY